MPVISLPLPMWVILPRDAESFPLPHWIWARPGTALANVMWREFHLGPLSRGVTKAWQLPLLCPWSPEPHIRSPGYPGGKRGQHGEVLGDEKAPAGKGPLGDHWGTRCEWRAMLDHVRHPTPSPEHCGAGTSHPSCALFRFTGENKMVALTHLVLMQQQIPETYFRV